MYTAQIMSQWLCWVPQCDLSIVELEAEDVVTNDLRTEFVHPHGFSVEYNKWCPMVECSITTMKATGNAEACVASDISGAWTSDNIYPYSGYF